MNPKRGLDFCPEVRNNLFFPWQCFKQSESTASVAVDPLVGGDFPSTVPCITIICKDIFCYDDYAQTKVQLSFFAIYNFFYSNAHYPTIHPPHSLETF
jgi:hypothetical protein